MTISDDSLALTIAARIELARRHPHDLALWSEAYRFFGDRPMELSPQLRGLYEDNHPRIVVMKAAQVGISEWLLNTALWAAYIGWAGRGNGIYYFPTLVMANDFSQARIDKAISESPLLSRHGDRRPRGRGAKRRNLLRFGLGHLYIRGTEEDRHLTTIDADLVILDELDRMRDGVYERAQARLSSSEAPLIRVASTPTQPNLGIDRLFQLGDQRRWYVRCPHCRQQQTKTWQENVDFKRQLVVCRLCRKPLPPDSPGRWVATRPKQSELHSYHFSKLDSRFFDVANAIEASRSSDPVRVDEFYNNDLGEPHVAEGGGLSVADLDEARRPETLLLGDRTVVVMGVDVGRRLHVVIRRFNRYSHKSWPLLIREVKDFEELATLFWEYEVDYCCIDAQPEIHKVSEFARVRPKYIYPAYYDRTGPGHSMDKGSRTMHLNRTQLFDQLFEAIRLEEYPLPENARSLGGAVRDGIGEYYRHLLALQRVVERDRAGDLVARYENANRADHFAHAEAYCFAMFLVRYARRKRPGVL